MVAKGTFSTPILIIAFNRLDTLPELCKRILAMNPSSVYVSCDGPRTNKSGEKEMTDRVRNYLSDTLQHVPQFRKNYSENNLGCRGGVTAALNWFFSEVEEGIILEDDVLPEEEFFSFMTMQLERHRNDERVLQISGANLIPPSLLKNRLTTAWYYGPRSSVWGWATWRRAWNCNDSSLSHFDKYIYSKQLRSEGYPTDYIKRKIGDLEQIYNKKLDTWDHVWDFSISMNRGKCVIPNGNLVSNRGFGADSTHTSGVPPGLETWRPWGLKPGPDPNPNELRKDLEVLEFRFFKKASRPKRSFSQVLIDWTVFLRYHLKKLLVGL